MRSTVYLSVARTVSLQMMLTRVQKQIFDQFHDVTLGFGTAYFWMPKPISDGWPMIAPDREALLSPQDEPLVMAANWLCLMGDEPPLGGPLQGGLLHSRSRLCSCMLIMPIGTRRCGVHPTRPDGCPPIRCFMERGQTGWGPIRSPSRFCFDDIG